MNDHAPFTAADLEELDERILARTSAVVSIREVHAGNHGHTVVGMRHDCDAGHSLATAVEMAEWEAERGYRSTYFMLHTSPYWRSSLFRSSLERIALLGHEIGIHTDALAEALRTGGDPHRILEDALEMLRSWGHAITGVAGHGNPLCNRKRGPGEVTFANDEQFAECARPREGKPDRLITRGQVTYRLDPRPLADFGLAYEAIRVSQPAGMPVWRVSDSGGRWKHVDYEPTFGEAVGLFNERTRFGTSEPWQLQMLIHPDWWAEAFVREAVAA